MLFNTSADVLKTELKVVYRGVVFLLAGDSKLQHRLINTMPMSC